MLAKRYFAPLLACMTLLTVGAAGEYACRVEQDRVEHDRRSQVTRVIGQYRAELEGELNATLFLTNGLIAYVQTHMSLEADMALPMLKTLFEQGRNVRNIGLAPGNRLTYVYPREGNAAVIGLHYPDLPDQWPAVERAMRERKPRLAGPVQLKQGGVGLIYRVPVFVGAKDEYWGLLSMVIDQDRLFAKTGIAPQVDGLQLALRGRDGAGADGDTFMGDAALFETDAVTATIKTPGGTWQIAARPIGGWIADARTGWIRLGSWTAGILLGVLLYLALASVARRLRAEEAVKISRDELNEAQRIGMLGSWRLDLRNNRLTWSDEIFRIFEIDKDKFGASYEAFLNTVHPEDRETVDRTYRESVANHTTYDIVHRLLFADGRIKYVRERCETFYGDDGGANFSRGTVQDITQIQEAEEALRASEARWKFALEGAGEGVWDWNIQTGEMFLSRQEMTVLGFDGEEAANTHINDWVERQHPDDRELRRAALERYLAGEAPLYTCEFRTRGRDGSWKWLLARGMLVSRTADGKPLRMIGTHSDVTERKQIDLALRESEARFRETFDNAPIGMLIGSLDHRVIRVNRAICEMLGYARDELIGLTLGDITHPDDVQLSVESMRRLLGGQDEAYPLEKRYLRKDGQAVWAQVTASLVRNAEGVPLYVIVQLEDITERRRSQEALRENEEKLRGLYELSPLGIALTDRSGRYVEFNEAFRRITGYTEDELRSLDYWTLTPKKYAADEQRQLETIARTGHYGPYEKEYVRKDGSLIPLRLNGMLVTGRDGNGYVWSIVEDITRWKQAESELQEQKDFLATILENEPECVKLIGPDGTVQQMNAAGLAMLEVGSVQEVNDCGFAAFVAPEQRPEFIGLMHRVFRGESGMLEFPIVGGRGTRRWLETHATPLRDAQGKVTHLLGVTRDVTRRREAEERLALSLMGADLAMTDWDVASDRMVFGDGWTKLLGYEPQELRPDSSTLAKLLRGEDLPAARAALIRHLKGDAPSVEAEVRLRHKDGHWVWVLARGMAVERNAEGWALRVTGTAMDITARKQAEAEIARLSQWNELLLNSAGEGIYGVDLEGRCTFINPAAITMIGFSREEALATRPHDLFHHHHGDGSIYPMKDCPIFVTLRDGIRREAEDAFIRKNGEVFPVQMTVTPMHEGGRIVGAEVVFQDIARRKAMEAELMRLATTDALTGVANRRRFLEQLEFELARIKRFGKPATLLMLDIDHFKNINDTYGHAIGDAALQHFAKLAQQRLRRVDLFGRLGGEEFGVLLPGTDGVGAWQFAERFRCHVADTPVQTAKGPIRFTVSIGIAEFDPSDDASDTILGRADVALYRAKDRGRNAVEVFASDLSMPVSYDSSSVDGRSIVRLSWTAGYACGEPVIDGEHIELFRLGNALLDCATDRDTNPGSFLAAFDALLSHVVEHFAHEEAILRAHRYAQASEHAELHRLLVERAASLRQQAGESGVSIGELVDFLISDVVARHMLVEDRKFYGLFADMSPDDGETGR